MEGDLRVIRARGGGRAARLVRLQGKVRRPRDQIGIRPVLAEPLAVFLHRRQLDLGRIGRGDVVAVTVLRRLRRRVRARRVRRIRRCRRRVRVRRPGDGRPAGEEGIDAAAEREVRLRAGGRLGRQGAVRLLLRVVPFHGDAGRVLPLRDRKRHADILRRRALAGEHDAPVRTFRRTDARREIGGGISVLRDGVHGVLGGDIGDGDRLPPAAPAALRQRPGMEPGRVEDDVRPAEADPFPVVDPQLEQRVPLPRQQVERVLLRGSGQLVHEQHVLVQHGRQPLGEQLRAVRRLLRAVRLRLHGAEILLRHGGKVELFRPMRAVERAVRRVRRLRIVRVQRAHEGAVLPRRIVRDLVGAVGIRRVPGKNGARGEKSVAQVRADGGERGDDLPIDVRAGRGGQLRLHAPLDGELRREHGQFLARDEAEELHRDRAVLLRHAGGQRAPPAVDARAARPRDAADETGVLEAEPLGARAVRQAESGVHFRVLRKGRDQEEAVPLCRALIHLLRHAARQRAGRIRKINHTTPSPEKCGRRVQARAALWRFYYSASARRNKASPPDFSPRAAFARKITRCAAPRRGRAWRPPRRARGRR